MSSFLALGVNIDHVATLRQARGTRYPDPIDAAVLAERSGADGITLHLREDRRHIQDRDVLMLKDILQTRMNLECAVTDEMINLALEVKPHSCCLVPERREEITTEGGLDVANNIDKVKTACQRLQTAGIAVSLFIEADEKQIQAAKQCGAEMVELHTGQYADAQTSTARLQQCQRIQVAAKLASDLGLVVNAGHGLHYHNVRDIARIPELAELNIGHAIIARAVITGLEESVRAMRQLMNESRGL